MGACCKTGPPRYLHYYSRSSSPATADKLLRKITDAARQAAEQPLLRRPRDDVKRGLRAVLVHPYLVFYRVQSAEVEIVRVLHERRDLPAAFSTTTQSER